MDRIVVTGSDGFIGEKVSKLASHLGAEVYGCDIQSSTGDIMKPEQLEALFEQVKPTLVIHLAAHKYATTAEEAPADIAALNILGTQNIVKACENNCCELMLASTCKAADPCTAYGASKLIAERVVLNYKFGRVFRLVNVIGSVGSVVEIWKNTPSDKPFKVVAGALRYFISPEEAAAFLLAASELPFQKVYAPDGLKLTQVATIADRLDPGRDIDWITLRRGDRRKERIIGEYEKGVKLKATSIMEVQQPWTCLK